MRLVSLLCVVDQESGDYHLVESSLELSSRTFSANVKSTNGDHAPLFSMVVREALSDGNLIEMNLI